MRARACFCVRCICAVMYNPHVSREGGRERKREREKERSGVQILNFLGCANVCCVCIGRVVARPGFDPLRDFQVCSRFSDPYPYTYGLVHLFYCFSTRQQCALARSCLFTFAGNYETNSALKMLCGTNSCICIDALWLSISH